MVRTSVLYALVLVLLGASGGLAQTVTWTGGGANDLLTTDANWSTGVAPVKSCANPPTGLIQLFTGSTRTTPAVPTICVGGSTNGEYRYMTIRFDAGAAPFNFVPADGTAFLGGYTNGQIINDSPNVQTFTVDVRPRDGTRIFANTADIVFNGGFAPGFGGTSRITRIRGPRDVYINGLMLVSTTASSGILTKGEDVNDTGTLFITNNGNTWNKALNIAYGPVRITVPNALGDAAGATNISGGNSAHGRLELDGAGAGGLTVAETINLSGRGDPPGFNPNPHIVNVSGDNTLTGANISLGTGGYDYIIQSSAGSLKIQSNIVNNTGGTVRRYLWLQGAADGEVAGIIQNGTGTGPFHLIKNGTGTWTLSNANTYPGTTTINAGTLKLAATGSIASSSSITVGPAATFDVSAVSGYTIGAAQSLGGSGTVVGDVADTAGAAIVPGTDGTAGTLAFAGSLSLNGGGTIKLDLANVTTVGGGVNDLITVAGDLSLTGTTSIQIYAMNGTLTAGTYRLITYGGTLTGDASNLTLLGLSGTRQSFAIDTSTPGQVNLLVGGAAASLLWQGDGVANLWDVNTTANWLNSGVPDKYFNLDTVEFNDTGSQNPPVNLTTELRPGAISVNTTGTYTFAGPGRIRGQGKLIKVGSGTLKLANEGENDYFGETIIGAGTLQVGDGGTAGNLGIGPVTNNGALVVNRDGQTAISGGISGTGSLTKQGPGTLVVGGTNTYEGPTVVSAGTLKADSGSALGSAVVGTTIADGATLDVNSQNLGAEVVTVQGAGVGGAGAIVNTGSATQMNALRYVTMTGDTTFGGTARWDLRNSGAGGALVGNGFSLTKVGPNVIALVTLGETGLANTVINEGTLMFAYDTTMGAAPGTVTVNAPGTLQLYNSAVTYDKDIVINDGGRLLVDGSEVTVSSTVTLNGATGILDVPSNGPLTFTGTVTGSGRLIKNGAEDVYFRGTNSWTGGTEINDGLFYVTSPVIGDVTVTAPGQFNFLPVLGGTITYGGKITGTGGWGVGGASDGTVILTGTEHDFTGRVHMAGGTIRLLNSSVLGAVGTGIDAGHTYISGARTRVELYNDITLGDPLQLAGRSTLLPQIVNVSGNNTWSGFVAIATGGSQYNIEAAGGKITFSGDFTADLGTPDVIRVLNLLGTAEGEISGGIGGVDAGRWHVVKRDAGTWTLSGGDRNTYYGPTTVKAGTLVVKDPAGMDGGELLSGTITIESGATLDVSTYGTYTMQMNQVLAGSGSVAGASTTLLMYSDNVLLPGDDDNGNIGTLALAGNLEMSADAPGSRLVFDLTSSTTPGSGVNDLLTVGGSITLDNNANIAIVPNGLLAIGTYRLIEYGGTLGGFGLLSLDNTTRYAMSLDTTTPGQVNLTVTGGAAKNLTWSGGSTGNWDLIGEPNWNGGTEQFYDADAVTFDDTSAMTTVNVIGTLAPSTITVNAAQDYTFSPDPLVGGKIGNGSSLTKAGTGTLTVNLNNSYTGVTTIAAGTLKIGHVNALGSGAGGTVVADGATLDVNGTFVIGSQEAITVQGAGVGGAGAIVNNGPSGGTGSGLKHAILAGDTTFGGLQRWDIRDGILEGNGYSLTKVGPNSIALKDLGDMNIANLNIQEGLIYNYGNTVPGQPGTGVINIGSSGSINFYASVSTTDPSTKVYKPIIMADGARILHSNGTADVGSPITLNGTANVDVASGLTLILSGGLAGPGGLLKTTTGTAVISGANTYAGNTTIAAGTLSLGATGTLPNSPLIDVQGGAALDVTGLSGGLTLGAGQTLKGTGTVRGSVTVNGTVSPGASIGTLTFTGGLVLAGTTEMEIDKTGTSLTSDRLTAAAVAYGGTLNVTATGDALAEGDTFDLFNAGSFTGAFAAVNLPALPAGLRWDTTGLLVDGTIRVVSGSAADFDNDGDVDVADFASFQVCFNGPNRPIPAGCTVDADLDDDGDVDVNDFAVFQTCFNGPARPPACDR